LSAKPDFDAGCGEERVLGDSDKPVTGGTVTVIPEGVSGPWEVRVDGH